MVMQSSLATKDSSRIVVAEGTENDCDPKICPKDKDGCRCTTAQGPSPEGKRTDSIGGY